ncbi:MAG: polysaccharide biosynthesis tyrosine autokinase [Bacteroidetes bacterium]|nr:polysaccharide biosynthesis tyrosine autokinase [Bacteroidota bacterium]
MDHNPWEADQEPQQQYLSGAAPAPNPRKSASAWDIQYRRILQVWPWMLPSGLLFLAVAWFYLRYQNDIYSVSSSIVIQDQSALQAANYFASKDPINDNIARLKSPTLMKRVVDTLGLQYQGVVRGTIKTREIYSDVKWQVLNRAPGTYAGLSFDVERIGERGFKWKSGNQTGTASWGIPFLIGKDQVVLTKKINRLPPKFHCYEVDPWTEAFSLVTGISLTGSRISNVVDMKMEMWEPQKGVDVLNTLIQTYNYSLLQERRKSQEQALRFIGERLEPLANSLDSIEMALAQFKADKGVILSGGYLSKYIGFDDEKWNFLQQQAILNSSETFLRNPNTKKNQIALPGVPDGTTQELITRLLSLWEERQKLALTVTEKNPKLKLLDKQIDEVRENLDVQLKNYKNINSISEDFLNKRQSDAEQKYRLSPFEEKKLNEMLRLQQIRLEQFLDLLKKNEEAGIAVASVSVETFIIRPALLPNIPIAPNRTQIKLTAFLIGIWLPFLIALIVEFLNNKIVSRNQLQQMLTPPVLAELDLVSNSADIMHIKRRDRSIFGEQVRSLRTALRYYAKEDKPFHVLLTSSMSGEGKTFISANLASSFALQGKRVALLEFDLRRPKLSKRFGYNEKQGISTVLIGKNDPSEIPIRISDDGHLDLFPAGPIPPNPSELLSSEKMNEFKTYLDANYDIIIMDTPPNGIVSDAQLLQDWTNITLVITRFRQTLREQVRDIEEWHNAGQFKPMAIIFNGVTVKGYYGYKYSYYYTKRKYGYKYYSGEEKIEGT